MRLARFKLLITMQVFCYSKVTWKRMHFVPILSFLWSVNKVLYDHFSPAEGEEVVLLVIYFILPNIAEYKNHNFYPHIIKDYNNPLWYFHCDQKVVGVVGDIIVLTRTASTHCGLRKYGKYSLPPFTLIHLEILVSLRSITCFS